MNRSFRFRAWDNSLNRFRWFDFLTAPNYAELPDPQQYIHLKDKNGMRIYEGDIVRLINSPRWNDNSYHMAGIGKVVFDFGELRFAAIKPTKYGEIMPLTWGGTESIEVIGNIYENPELLEVAK